MEIDALIKTKLPDSLRHINETCKGLLCLDISCELMNVPFDSSQAIVFAVLRANLYKSKRNMIMKILNLSKVLDIRDIILKLEIFPFDVLEETANRIFAKYKEQKLFCGYANETSVAAMCVHFAGKIEKIKVPQNLLIQLSNLSSAQWKSMTKLWSPWALAIEKKKKLNQRKIMLNDMKEIDEIELEIPDVEKIKDDENDEEPYDDWAMRIIKKARQDLKKQKKSKVIIIL